MADQPVVLLGICGGIAAYKAVTVASKLLQAGCAVHVAMTDAAQRFVPPLTFSAVTRRRVLTSGFPGPEARAGEDFFPHLYPATRADVLCVLPATADIIAKLAHGEADDIVCACAVPLPPRCRRYLCPSMNADMWENPTVQENLATLRARGWLQLGPDQGLLACGTEGYGRMVEPEAITARLLDDLRQRDRFAGKTILVLSGPTVEPLDPVRFLSNHSSGKMGQALAEAASARGATVEFVTGPVPAANLPTGPGIVVTKIQSAKEMLAAATARFGAAHAAIFVAAVADYRPAAAAAKRPKSRKLTLELVANPDIAATLSAKKKSGQLCLGFALETHDGPAHARTKLGRKHLDAIVLNTPASFGAADGDFTLLTPDATDVWGRLPKTECAARLLNFLAARWHRA